MTHRRREVMMYEHKPSGQTFGNVGVTPAGPESGAVESPRSPGLDLSTRTHQPMSARRTAKNRERTGHPQTHGPTRKLQILSNR